jgi:hypothetical protein
MRANSFGLIPKMARNRRDKCRSLMLSAAAKKAGTEERVMPKAFRRVGNQRIGISFAQVCAQKIRHKGNPLDAGASSRDFSSNTLNARRSNISLKPILAFAKAPVQPPRNRGAASGLSRTTTTPIGPTGSIVNTPDRTFVAT